MLNDVGRQRKMSRATVPMVGPVADDTLDSLVAVLDIVRHEFATTRPEIIRQTGLGRSVVVQRVQELLDRGLLFESGLAASSGGRAPRSLQFNARAGHILVADLGATSIDVGVADLAGNLLAEAGEPADIMDGPDAILGRVREMFDELIGRRPRAPGELWGIGIGLPGPVEFAAGRPVSPPIMPGWDDYPVRARFADRYEVPVWVDNDANLMALGEFRTGVAQGHSASIFLKVGTGIGAGIIIAGRLHRGAQGSAGDVGHIQVTDDPAIVCRCGNIGCLEALAGGAALGRDGTQAARDGRSSEPPSSFAARFAPFSGRSVVAMKPLGPSAAGLADCNVATGMLRHLLGPAAAPGDKCQTAPGSCLYRSEPSVSLSQRKARPSLHPGGLFASGA